VDVVRRIVEVYVAMWGDIPYEHYTFLFVAGGGGGLEHCGSTTIGIRPFLLRRDPAASKGVTAHEFHHTWNVKRLRPFALGPFDYDRPVVVNDLWICEGLTSYYTNLGLWRAGLLTDREFWGRYEAAISRFERNRASARLSPQESSRSVWEGWPEVSYYGQGELLGLLLDLLIRDGSNNAHGLEDVMRAMYVRYGGYYRDRRAKPGYRSADWPRVIREVTGVDVRPFFADHVERALPIAWNRYLGLAGVSIELRPETTSMWRTLTLTSDGAVIAPAGSFFETAGLREGDRLLTWRGRPAARSFRPRALQGLRADEEVDCVVERDGEQLSLRLPSRAAAETADVRTEVRKGQLVLTDLRWDSSLRIAGIREGEIVTSIGGETGPPLRLRAALLGAEVGARLRIGVRRQPGDGASAAAAERVLVTGPLRPDIVRRAGSLRLEEGATPRQLHLREALRTGHRKAIP
jgi:predicted metalloprotease with PDZ domain